ncbi:MAG: heparinase II/III-family protein [Lachnospiraceae bacterium]|nr:heparinase II/III-family protein [Lachnospiraceae bacterium]
MNTNRTTISHTFRKAAIKEAELCLNADAGDLSEELYTEFARSGNRVNYEGVNFRRRKLLNRLAIGELCEGEGRFLPELSRIIGCTLRERSWVLPAHSGGRLPDGVETNIDLFSSQTAAALAMISARLPLDAALQKQIWETIDARIFVPLLTHDYWWRDLGENRRPTPSNWTPWCIHGVLECVRSVLPDALPWDEAETAWAQAQPSSYFASLLPVGRLPQLQEIADSCLASLRNYFEDYPDDGGCDEGAQYWEHSVGHFFECGLCQSFDAAKLAAMYSFIQKVHITGNYYMNFADCAARIKPNASMIFRMGTEGNLPKLSAFGAALYHAHSTVDPDPTLRDNMDFRAVLNAALASADLENYADEPAYRQRDCFPSLEAGIFRGRHFCMAVKGGHNGENHNHNDCGNVIVYAAGSPVLIDAGVGAYTRDTFSERRYTIWTMQSSFHNLPEINGCMQHDGAEYTARDAVFSEDSFSCELSAAYPRQAGILSYCRSMQLEESRVTLTSHFVFKGDKFKGNKNCVILNYMLAERPELEDERNDFREQKAGRLAVHTARPDAGCRARAGGCILTLPAGEWSVETIEFGEDEKLSPVWGHCVFRLRGRIETAEREFTAVTVIE